MSVRVILLLLYMATAAFGQGFAGLGQNAEGFSLPKQGAPLVFPRDHGPHSDFRIEWWYVTANLKMEGGQDYGVQWTLFRSSLSPDASMNAGWSKPELWMGHAAVTTKTDHYVAERLGRGGIGQAGVTTAPFSAWIDDWQMKGEASAAANAISTLQLSATGEAFSYALTLTTAKPVVRQGDRGYSVKSGKGQASYYYSQPFYEVTGTLDIPGGAVKVTGQAWLDHEWSSQPLAEDQTGWDWFSLHFASGEKLMGFRLRDSGDGFTSATWIAADGTPEPQQPGMLKVTPLETATVAGRSLPIRWRVELPTRGIDVTTAALNRNAWMTTQVQYWEGPVALEGSHKGQGYVEMTGYD